MPLSVHFPFVLQLLMVPEERAQWLTCWFIPVIEICALKHSQDQLSSGQSCKANQHLSSAKLCLPSSLVLGEAKHFQKHIQIIWFVHSPCCLENMKTAKYAKAKINKLWMQKTDLQSVWVWDISTACMDCPCYHNLDVLLTWLQTLGRTEITSVFILAVKRSRS